MAPRDREVAKNWGLPEEWDLTPSAKTIRRNNPRCWLKGLPLLKDEHRNEWKPGAEIKLTRDEFEKYLDRGSEDRVIFLGGGSRL